MKIATSLRQPPAQITITFRFVRVRSCPSSEPVARLVRVYVHALSNRLSCTRRVESQLRQHITLKYKTTTVHSLFPLPLPLPPLNNIASTS